MVLWIARGRRVTAQQVLLCTLLFAAAIIPARPTTAQEQTDNEAARRQFAAAAALQNRDQFELAADEWQKFLREFGKDVLAPRARHYLGLCQLKAKQYPAAAATLEPLLAEKGKFDLLEATYLYLGLAQYNLGTAGDAKQLPRAAATFTQQLEKFPQGQHAAQAAFYQGETAYAQGQKPQAIAAYKLVADRYPKDPLAADALYAIGVTYEELGQPANAGPIYDRFLTSFKEHALATEVGMRRGETLLAEGKLDDAEKRFATAAGVAGFALADHALMRQAACLYQKQQYAPAAVLYASVGQRFPKSRYIAAAQLAAGKCAFLAGDYVQARKSLDPLKDQADDTGAEAGHWIVRGLLKQQQLDEAQRTADALVKRHKQGTWAGQLALDQADVMFEQPQRRADAVKAYASIVDQFAKDPVAPQALYLAAFAALNASDYATAIKHTETFLKQFPDHEQNVDVRYVAAESYLQRGDYDSAEKRYAELVSRSPQHRDVGLWQLRRGLCSYLKKDYAQAVKHLTAIVGTLPTAAWKAEAYYLLGASQLELKQFKEAIASLQAAMSADGKWRQADETLLALAQAQRQSGQLDAARQTLESLLKNFPNSATRDRGHYRLADLLFAQADYPRAIAEYRALLAEQGTSNLAPHALHGLAWAQFRGNDAAGALKSLDDLLQRHAKHEAAAQAPYLRALVYQELKQPNKAIDDLTAYLKTGPKGNELSNARYALGLAQASAKSNDAAVTTFRQLLKDDPQYADADKVLYETAWALRGVDKLDEAADTFARLAKDYSKSPLAAESLYHAGDRRYEQKQWKEAAQAYYEAARKAGESPLGEKATHKLGWTYFQQNNFNDAEQTFVYQGQTWPRGELLADGQFMAGESLFKQGKHQPALAAFLKVQNPPRKELALLALLHAAQSASALQDWKQAQTLAAQAQAVDPASPYQAEALYEQAWALQNQGRHDEALKLYEDVTAKSDAEVAARARFFIGEIYFERKEHKEAIRNFFKVAFGYNYPDWQAAAHYEAARCFEVLKDLTQARKSYQEVVDKYPKSDRADPARKRLEALGK